MTLSRDRFDDLYRCHAPSAFRRARRVLGSEADAREVVHDLFLSLWERPEQYAGKSSMSTFIYGAVTHACLNRIRNHKRRLQLIQQHLSAQPTDANSGADAEQSAALRAALARMPEQLAQVAIYYYFDELTHRDIARILGCSRRHVGDLLERLSQWVERTEVQACNP